MIGPAKRGLELLLCACLSAMLLLPAKLYAEEKPGQYDDFLLRFSYGLGQGKFVSRGEGPYHHEAKADLTKLGWYLGYALNPNWILHTGLNFSERERAKYQFGLTGEEHDARKSIYEDRPQVSLDEFSSEFGLSYYFSPENYSLSFALYYPSIVLEYRNDLGEDEYKYYQGSGFGLGLAKEWWLGDNVAFSIALKYYYASIDDRSGDAYNLEHVRDGKYSYYGIFFSLGYDP